MGGTKGARVFKGGGRSGGGGLRSWCVSVLRRPTRAARIGDLRFMGPQENADDRVQKGIEAQMCQQHCIRKFQLTRALAIHGIIYLVLHSPNPVRFQISGTTLRGPQA